MSRLLTRLPVRLPLRLPAPEMILLTALSLLALAPLMLPGYFFAAHDGRHSVFYLIQFDAGLRDGALTPDYTGIRAKITGPGEPPADFVIHGEREHGIPGLVNLFGIESPGLTSSMAIADHVATLLGIETPDDIPAAPLAG